MENHPHNDEATQDTERPSVQRLSASDTERPSQIYLVPYPKFVFLYPTFVACLVATIWMMVTGRHVVGPDDTVAVTLTWTFLGVMAVNSVVIAFDFPRATSLTMFFLIVTVVFGAILTFNIRPDWFPRIAGWLETVRPVANSTFFAIVLLVMSLIYVAVFIVVRFDYWEVRPNELLHHHGFLSDLKRYSAPNLRIDKEINDIFEYLLLGSGRLILQPSGERRAIILENVLFISKKEASITKMLGALQVQVRSDNS